MNNKDVVAINPNNFGWLEYRLDKQELDFARRCIDKREKSTFKNNLAGNISESNTLLDRGDWFWTNTIQPLVKRHIKEFGTELRSYDKPHPYYMNTWWVNYQKKNEFNPLHDHTGSYSFVIWMKIPTSHFQQNKKPISLFSNSHSISNFQFIYTDTLGNVRMQDYELSPKDEGRLLFFPGKLKHCVYPFYDCDEERISVSGNILVDSTRTIPFGSP